tara:strand:+ start:673 stop:870 length:198 start_codon:yes stop_codon:yes gene_type:complete
MPSVHFPYTKAGREKAKAAAKEFGGRYVDDKKEDHGMSVMIAVGAAPKKAATKKTTKGTRRKKKA